MMLIQKDLSNLQDLFPNTFTKEQVSACKTLFLKKLALKAHAYYKGKMQTVPKVPVNGYNWFNVWYTPGVSAISTAIRDNNDLSYTYTNRSNLVAVLSDSTRVLGDGNCTPPGGLSVMEGKAFLMKYLGGIDAMALCIDSRDETGNNNPDNIVNFARMVQHSFGAINLEDISSPNCFKVLDDCQKVCDIPVWHDDAQGTACVTLAGLTNALRLTGKKIQEAKIVLFGAGAANSSIARLLMADGAQGKNIILFDINGSLNIHRTDYQNNPMAYRQWDLCQKTNPLCITSIEEAFKNADVVISLSKPGPDTIKPEWIQLMAPKPVVFACANPVPEIYPYAAKDAGAYIVATGRGDFPNQVNNSVCFPSILKGVLSVQSRKITDTMTIAAAHAIADFAYQRGITVDNIIPKMSENDVFPYVAAEVAMQARKEGLARLPLTKKEVYDMAQQDISDAQKTINILTEQNMLPQMQETDIQAILNEAINEITHKS
ncbi:MAG: NADP-dependent malic enzyme [Bacteroidales bacterium]|nr:NADP-dependent malic enzyme [Bacteroidales bacterium]